MECWQLEYILFGVRVKIVLSMYFGSDTLLGNNKLSGGGFVGRRKMSEMGDGRRVHADHGEQQQRGAALMMLATGVGADVRVDDDGRCRWLLTVIRVLDGRWSIDDRWSRSMVKSR